METVSISFRSCSHCRQDLPTSDFYLKSNGKGGRDSRCKTCIIRLRKASRERKKARSRYITMFASKTIGSADKESIEQFGEVFAIGIRDLLEKGFLK